MTQCIVLFFFFSSRRRHTRLQGDWSSDVCSSDLGMAFTVWDEVAFGPANLGWPREQITRHVDRALARLEIAALRDREPATLDRKSTRLNSSHLVISYAVFCLKKKNKPRNTHTTED